MLSEKQINERISFAFNDLKIPVKAERILLDDELFQKLYKCGDAEIYEYQHCCGNEIYNGEDFWKHNCWIEVYSEGNWNFTKNDVWNIFKGLFSQFSEESRKNPVAYRLDEKNKNLITLYIIGRHCDSHCSDYIICITPEKVNLRKNFPVSYYMTRFGKNSIPLREILKYNNPKISA